jgi:hypothetical protein
MQDDGRLWPEQSCLRSEAADLASMAARKSVRCELTDVYQTMYLNRWSTCVVPFFFFGPSCSIHFSSALRTHISPVRSHRLSIRLVSSRKHTHLCHHCERHCVHHVCTHVLSGLSRAIIGCTGLLSSSLWRCFAFCLVLIVVLRVVLYYLILLCVCVCVWVS